ncbi:nucleolar complex protein 4 homolog B [Amblyomma americanum]|uniref:CCAAT-binding factor domain-containing protein n=1 Tax=Amblyomma americanum TaxID=6943 RepID=A0AAQ4ERX9_AMBAM
MAKGRRSKKAPTSSEKLQESASAENGEKCTPSSPSQEAVAKGKEIQDLDSEIATDVVKERSSNASKESEDVAKSKKRQDSVSDVKKNASLVIEDRKNSNLLIDIVGSLSSKSDDVVIAGAQAANKVFCHFLKTSAALYESDSLAGKPAESESPLEKYHAWLRDRYADAWRHIVAMLSGKSSSRKQSLALQVAMKWIELETVYRKQGEHHVPINKLGTVVETLLDPEHDMKSIISKFSQYLDLADVKTYTLKALGRIARTWRVNPQAPAEMKGDGEEPASQKKPELTDRYLTNVYHLLLGFDMAAEPPKAGEPIAVLGGDSMRYVIDREQEVKRLSTVWITFLRQKLPFRLYRELLIMLPEKVVPYLHNPLLVTDFFIESYNRGGSHSLMALNGLFVLIHRYHLDYPNFYEKLYALLEPDVFYQKYRARFFFLTDLFLSSTHLPAYLVASFAKKLARMALSAPPYALLYMIPFIGNLLIRHRSLSTMINDPSDQDASTDPFDVEQANPSKSQAADSSLWELKTLQSHWHPTVAKKAKFIDDNLPRMEWDFSERLEEGYAEMMKRSKAAKHKEAPTNFHKVEGLLKQKEELLSELWTLE